MARIAGISVIMLLLLQLTVPFFYIQTKRNAFYQEAKKRMKRDLAVKIPAADLLADKNFHWEKDGKEFVFNGGLYDVAKMQIENGEYVMYAVPDFAEKEFLSQMAKQDPTSDDGVFSSYPVHWVLPMDKISVSFFSISTIRGFVYGEHVLTADQLPEETPPKNLI